MADPLLKWLGALVQGDVTRITARAAFQWNAKDADVIRSIGRLGDLQTAITRCARVFDREEQEHKLAATKPRYSWLFEALIVAAHL